MDIEDNDLIQELKEEDCECYWQCFLSAEKLRKGWGGIEIYSARKILSDNAWKILCEYFKEKGVDCQSIYEEEAKNPCHEKCDYLEYNEGLETADLYPEGDYFKEI